MPGRGPLGMGAEPGSAAKRSRVRRHGLRASRDHSRSGAADDLRAAPPSEGRTRCAYQRARGRPARTQAEAWSEPRAWNRTGRRRASPRGHRPNLAGGRDGAVEPTTGGHVHKVFRSHSCVGCRCITCRCAHTGRRSFTIVCMCGVLVRFFALQLVRTVARSW